MTTDTLAPLLQAIERLTDAVLTGVPMDKRLWNAEACAQYLGYSRSHFLQHIACRPDFPRARFVGTGEGGRRWKAAEVMRWADARRAP